MDGKRYQELAEKWLNGTITDAEKKEFTEWYNSRGSGEIWTLPEPLLKNESQIRDRLWKQIEEQTTTPVVEMVPRKRRKIWIAAASIVLLLGLGSYFAIQMFTGSEPKDSQPVTVNQHTGTDALPGKFKAKLTLAGGEEIILDSVSSGTLAKQGGIIVVQQDGQLVYKGKENSSSALVYNAVTTARGETYSLTLSDGTKVWLNSQSSLRFPVVFGNDQRKVEFTGEAYFEVSKDPSKKFIVSTRGTETEVLGTHFNINAYDDEPDARITLLEGSVQVNNQLSTVKIKPGEQAVAKFNSPLVINHSPDIEQVVAWKNGLFNFNRSDLKTVMRQLSRWYDVNVEYSGAIPDEHFSGKVPRNLNASKVLQALEYSGVKFKIEGEKLIVYP